MRFENFIKLIFIWSTTNNLYPLPIRSPSHDCQSNMGAELPAFRIYHPKPCSRKIHVILGCVLLIHGFVWKIRNNGSSAPIFHRQSSILLCNRGVYRPLVCEHTKNDDKPIFRSLEQCLNLALILETTKTGAASIFLWSHTNVWCVPLLHGNILDWPQNMVRRFLKLRPEHTYMCVY